MGGVVPGQLAVHPKARLEHLDALPAAQLAVAGVHAPRRLAVLLLDDARARAPELEVQVGVLHPDGLVVKIGLWHRRVVEVAARGEHLLPVGVELRVRLDDVHHVEVALLPDERAGPLLLGRREELLLAVGADQRPQRVAVSRANLDENPPPALGVGLLLVRRHVRQRRRVRIHQVGVSRGRRRFGVCDWLFPQSSVRPAVAHVLREAPHVVLHREGRLDRSILPRSRERHKQGARDPAAGEP
mmetsp:Transcript_2181/g.7158  ORF Transcript_2181/g.7158 Transcript_2181/m.7158 type:complete len:243 (-) Transcript_2181:66-794(-)